jgi:hypothetical protein
MVIPGEQEVILLPMTIGANHVGCCPLNMVIGRMSLDDNIVWSQTDLVAPCEKLACRCYRIRISN